MPDGPALALFQKQWQLYRKVVDRNYLFHREAYNCLHRILVDEAIQPFRFLDVACGDASVTVEALRDQPEPVDAAWITSRCITS